MIPALIILLSPLVCSNKDNSSAKSLNYYYGYECWTPYHFVLSIFGLIYALIAIITLSIQSLLYNDPRSEGKLPWACA